MHRDTPRLRDRGLTDRPSGDGASGSDRLDADGEWTRGASNWSRCLVDGSMT